MEGPLDVSMEYDVIMGSNAVKCLHCGASVARSHLLDDEMICPECGKKFNV